MRPRHTLSLLRLGMVLACVVAARGLHQGRPVRSDDIARQRYVRHQEAVPGPARTGVPQRRARRPTPAFRPTSTKAISRLPRGCRQARQRRSRAPVASAEKPAEKPKPKAKLKPKPKVARAPEPPRTKISVGMKKPPASGRAAGRAAQSPGRRRRHGCVANRVASAAADRRWPAGRPTVPVAVDLA